MIRGRFVQETSEGLWTSPDVFSFAEPRYALQGLLAGWIMGRARWLVSENGEFLYGITRKGTPMPLPVKGAVQVEA